MLSSGPWRIHSDILLQKHVCALDSCERNHGHCSMSSICQSVCRSLTLLSAPQSELLKARDSSPRPDTLATTPAKGMWKHAKLMTQLRPDHPASLQALQMCRRATVEEAKISAMDTHQPITISAEDQTISAQDQKQDSVMMKKGYRNAMQTCKDPALAMQHLLYCMMRVLLVQIPAAEHTKFAHNDQVRWPSVEWHHDAL